MSKISNYKELLAERQRLESKIIEQKAAINQNVLALRERLSPFLLLLPALNIFKKVNTASTLLMWVASVGIDVLVGQRFFKRSNWITRLLVPRFLKGVATSALSDKK